MITSIIIAILSCVLLIMFSLFKPSFKIYKWKIDSFWVVALVGALFTFITKTLKISDFMSAITHNSAINPIKIIILLLSLAFLSTTLDKLNFFSLIASSVVKKVKHSQVKLFFVMYALVAILTMFSSNDIIILTFTLFICYFSRITKINPIPYLVMEFVVANTFSMIFIIGNPTNIYLGTSCNIDFLSYFKVMVLPTLISGIVATIVLYLLFRKDLKKDFVKTNIEVPKLKNKPLTFISLTILIITIILLVISNYIHVEMWIITLLSASSVFLSLIVHSIIKKDKETIVEIVKAEPWSLGIFVLAMYAIVLSLNVNNVLINVSNVFDKIANNNKIITIFLYGLSSTLSDNLINNIPMSLAYSGIISNSSANLLNAKIFSTIIGSNVGAYLTPIGALAGIMWMRILKDQKVNYSFFDFTKKGILLTLSILIAALTTLSFII